MKLTRFRTRRNHAATITAAAAVIAIGLSLLPTGAARAQDLGNTFAIKDGDKICFYGDSITDQRMYTLLTEDYIVTRFPGRNVSFVHSGWGGDRVTGGGGGPIDLRLDRDVFAYKPTVVTIMLGMNDGGYRAFDPALFTTYSNGYRHIVDRLTKELPGVRLTLIQASPFDDVTRAPGWNPGYNSVLKQYAGFVATLAGETHQNTADLNSPVVAMLTKAKETDPDLAQKILPDRVHPAWGGHLVMAEALLKSWNAPALVSAVRVDASGNGSGDNAKVENVKAGSDGSLNWKSTEGSLPFPLAIPFNNNDAEYKLALSSSDFVDTLDRETLTATGLTAPSYTLKIDDTEVGTFTKEELAQGINLATYPTPMLKQAQYVDMLTHRRSDTHNARWRSYQVPLADDKAVSGSLRAVMDSLDRLDEDLARERRSAAQPKPHTFTLAPKS